MNPRFELALDHLRPTDWARFEKLCSDFLAPEWPALRTVASQSGDGGRDAQLFTPKDDPAVLLQYSVAKDWKTKLQDTAEIISNNFPDANILVFLSNQDVGAKADEIKATIRMSKRLFVDVRDRSWFLERAESDPYRAELAEQLSQEITDRYLFEKRIISHSAQALSSVEAKSALIFLGLQWEDDTREKGLTKLCFEALVKAALRDATPENRLSRQQMLDKVHSYLPTHAADQIDTYVDSALTRMRRRSLNFSAPDLYCLSHGERERLAESLAQFEIHDGILSAEISSYVESRTAQVDQSKVERDVESRVRRVLEKFLLKNGSLFAEAVVGGEFTTIPLTELRSIVISDCKDHRIPKEFTETIDVVQSMLIRLTPNSTAFSCASLSVESVEMVERLCGLPMKSKGLQGAPSAGQSHAAWWMPAGQ